MDKNHGYVVYSNSFRWKSEFKNSFAKDYFMWFFSPKGFLSFLKPNSKLLISDFPNHRILILLLSLKNNVKWLIWNDLNEVENHYTKTQVKDILRKTKICMPYNPKKKLFNLEPSVEILKFPINRQHYNIVRIRHLIFAGNTMYNDKCIPRNVKSFIDEYTLKDLDYNQLYLYLENETRTFEELNHSLLYFRSSLLKRLIKSLEYSNFTLHIIGSSLSQVDQSEFLKYHPRSYISNWHSSILNSNLGVVYLDLGSLSTNDPDYPRVYKYLNTNCKLLSIYNSFMPVRSELSDIPKFKNLDELKSFIR